MASLSDIDFASIPGSSALADGEYVACITASEKKTGRDSGDDYLALTIQVIEGPRKGFIGRDNLSLWSSKDNAKSIAQDKIKKIALACGKTKVSDSSELHNIPMLVTFKTEKGYSNPVSYKAKTAVASSAVAVPAVNPFA
jgi:hypothetical protein